MRSRIWRGVFQVVILAALTAGLLGDAGAGDALRRRADADRVRPVKITARPIVDFHASEPGVTRFGALEFIGGLVLTADDPAFGSLSALRTRDHGRELLSVSDEGTWFTARLVTDEAGRPRGITDSRLAPLRDDQGRPLVGKWLSDAESVVLIERGAELEALVGFEMRDRVLTYRSTTGFDGLLRASGQMMPGQPKDLRSVKSNKGLEAMAAAPSGSRLAGAVVMVSEDPRKGERDHRGWIVGGPTPGVFNVLRRDDFSLTDACFLPSGDLLVLERRASLMRGLSMRIRRIAGRDIAPGRVVDGAVLIEADWGYEIDNMEGLAVDTAPDGTPILTLLSDDNQSWMQRTVLLRFRMAEGPAKSAPN